MQLQFRNVSETFAPIVPQEYLILTKTPSSNHHQLIFYDILSDTYSGILSDRYSCILSDIYFGIQSDMYSDTLSDIYCCILSWIYCDSCPDLNSYIPLEQIFWHSIWHPTWRTLSEKMALYLAFSWHCIWHIQVLWHSIWHFLRHSIWHFLSISLGLYLTQRAGGLTIDWGVRERWRACDSLGRAWSLRVWRGAESW